jgi:hypothetical protein
VRGAAKTAATAVSDAAAKLVGAGDAETRAEEFAERAEAHHAKVAAEDALADFERAKVNAVERFDAIPQTGPYQLRFATAETFLDGAIDVERDELVDAGHGNSAHVTYAKPVDFPPEGDPAAVIEAWLIAPSGEAVRSFVSVAPLNVGGGRVVQIPANNLLF